MANGHRTQIKRERNDDIMNIKDAFKLISDKVESALTPQGFTRQKVSGNDNEMVALFTSETSAYSVVYFHDKKHMVMRHCAMTEDGPDNNWKTLATWMFDPDTDTNKEAESIANDFVENCSGTIAAKRLKNTKKKNLNRVSTVLFIIIVIDLIVTIVTKYLH